MHRCLLPMLLVACGDNLANIDAPFSEAQHTSAPQILSVGGPVLASPEIVPIFFAANGHADDLQGDLEAYLRALATSNYWKTIATEYGVGVPTIEPSIVTSATPPTTDDQLQGLLEANLGHPTNELQLADSGRWPQPNANTMYVVFLPADVTLSVGSDISCKTFGGYHDETTQSQIVYALLPRCPTTGAPIDEISPATSHELIEASTDPHPGTAPAFVEVDDTDLIWAFTPGGELGDMCEYVAAAYQRLVGNYLVQRIWSNASAAAGHDPCVPTLPGPFVGAAPHVVDVMLDYPGGSTTTRGVQVPNGSSVTIDLDLFSDAPATDWTVGTDDVASTLQMLPAELSFTFDSLIGNNGSKIRLTIKRLKVGDNGGSEFVVTSKVGGVVVALWWGLATD